jgi:hypothetical protein
MIESINASIDNLVVHQMGCKSLGEELRLSKTSMNPSEYEGVADILKDFFFRPFKTEAYFNLAAPEGGNNYVKHLMDELFADATLFYQTSVSIAQLLDSCSNNPNIRGGELYIAHFIDCAVDGQLCDAIGIFKSESKETFLRVVVGEGRVELGAQEGISIKKLDKGCIIFNIESEEGYRVCAIDNINKGQEARFWMDDFLGLKPREDNYFYTDNYLQMCKGFMNDVFNDENHIPRTERIDLMNRSIEFFNNNPQFSQQQFQEKVMSDTESINDFDIIGEFDKYKQKYEEEHELPQALPTEFEISKDAVKGEKKNFKSVIKLDKNFHVYIHGGRYYMEKGYDEGRDLNFYKLYYKIEQ